MSQENNSSSEQKFDVPKLETGVGASEKKHVSSIEKLLNLIFGISSNSTTKRLKVIHKKLLKQGCKYFNFRKDTVGPKFAEFLYGVYTNMAPLHTFFMQNTKDEFYAISLIHYYMSESMADKENSLSVEHITKEAGECNYESLKIDVENRINSFVSSFTKEYKNKVNFTFDNVIKLKQFASFDFYALLKKFCGSLKENDFSQPVHFNYVARKHVETEILDFLSSLATVVSVTDWLNAFEFLSNMNGYKNIEYSDFVKYMESLRIIFEDNTLQSFSCLVSKNPDFVLSADKRMKDLVTPYIQEKKDSALSNLSSILEEKKTERMISLQRNVFGNDPILGLTNYGHSLAASLEELNVSSDIKMGLKFYRQAEYYHTFCEGFLSKEASKFMDVFSVRAWSEGSEYTLKFSSIYHSALDKDKEIMLLDSQLSPNFQLGAKIRTYYKKAKANSMSDVVLKLSAELAVINEKMGTIVFSGLATLREYYKLVRRLSVDSKSPSPSLIKNWTDLDNFLKESSSTSLEKMENKLKNFIELMEFSE